MLCAEFTDNREIRFWWWTGYDQHLHRQKLESWSWDGDVGEVTFHCEDAVLVIFGNIWRPDHLSILEQFVNVLGPVINIPHPETGSHYAKV